METRAPEILVLLSGGVDSFACADFYKSMGRPIELLHVNYGQAAERHEHDAAARVAEFLGLPLSHLSLLAARPKEAGEIQGRNAFLVCTAAMEASASVRGIALGIHAGTAYPDCSPAFLECLNALNGLAQPSVRVLAPFLEWNKADVFGYCEERCLPIDLTYSCERGGSVPCGACLSCLDRGGLDARA
jgi:7-cyano-7-deazaguanine synthase